MKYFVFLVVSNVFTGLSSFMIVMMLSGASCDPPPPEPAPTPDPDSGPCAQACANMERLKCAGWEGSPGPDGKMDTADDVPCTPSCVAYITIDPTADGYQGCQANAPTCEAFDACYEE